MVRVGDRTPQGRLHLGLRPEPPAHLVGRPVEHFQERDVIHGRVVSRLGLRQKVLGEEVG